MRCTAVVTAGMTALLAAFTALALSAATPASASVEVPPAGGAAAAPGPAELHPHPVDNCAAYRADRLVRVSIRAQHVWLCHRRHTVFESAATTGRAGRGTRTPTGRFRIEGLDRQTTLLPSTGGAYHVRYWIPFIAPEYGFHDASWQHFPYGSPRYRTHGSHGCVHLPLPAMRFLYHWARIGTPVVIA